MREIVNNLIAEYGTSDPFTIAKRLGISIIYRKLGTVNGFLKTFNVENTIHSFIFINENLEDMEQYYTVAHELGHYILHPDTDINFLRKYNASYPKGRYEREADLFASYFIITDEEMLEIDNLPYISKAYNLDYAICEERVRYILDGD